MLSQYNTPPRYTVAIPSNAELHCCYTKRKGGEFMKPVDFHKLSTFFIWP